MGLLLWRGELGEGVQPNTDCAVSRSPCLTPNPPSSPYSLPMYVARFHSIGRYELAQYLYE
jgi:hypothetical protein